MDLERVTPRRPPRPGRPVLTALPPTASPRGVATQVGRLFCSGAVLAWATAVVPGAGPDPTVAVAVGALAVVLGGAVLRRGRLPRRALHLVLVLASVLTAAMSLTSTDPLMALAFSQAFTVVALIAIATCSWVGAAPHVLLSLAGVLVGHGVDQGRPWAATLTTVFVLLTVCVFAGSLVRAAGTAEVDALTGLTNRRGAERHLDTVTETVRTGRRAAVALIDLDHFKVTNDTWGHAAGDELLRRVAVSLHRAVADLSDQGSQVLAARWGGDEFVLCAPVSAEELAAVVGKVRARLGRRVSCSVGVTGLRPGDTPVRALARADQALYRAKSSTRGRTLIASAAGDHSSRHPPRTEVREHRP